jgi:hypothetical protein
MPQIYPDEGLILNLLNVVDNGGSGLNWILWTNDIEPELDTVSADLEFADATWAKRNLKALDFPFNLTNLHVGTVQASPVVFLNDSALAVDIYGYAAVDPLGEDLVLVCRFADAPRHVAIGGTLSLTPMVGDSSQVLTDTIDGGTF